MMSTKFEIVYSETQEKYDQLVKRGDYFLALEVASALALSPSEVVVVQAIERKARCFDALGASELEIQCYEQGIARFGKSEETVARGIVNQLFYNLSITLDNVGKTEAALDAVVQLRGRLRVEDQEERLRLAKAEFNALTFLFKLGRHIEFDKQVSRMDDLFGTDEEARVRTQAGRALAVKAERLKGEGKNVEAIEFADKAIALIEDTTDVGPLLVPAIRASRAVSLAKTGRGEEAEEEFKQIVKEFKTPEDIEAAHFIGVTHFNRVVNLFEMAKPADASRAAEEAIASLRKWEEDEEISKMIRRLEQAVEERANARRETAAELT